MNGLDLRELQRRVRMGEVFSYIFFWGHQVPRDGRISASCMSQWYPESFVIDGIRYPTAEHWMMASKARLFQDEDALQAILQTDSPKEAKSLGRAVRKFNASLWDQNKRQLVTEGNEAKFSQNSDLRAFLIGTGTTVIVEASPVDSIWGIGLAASDPRANNPLEWQGNNLLGFALMDVRERLSQL